MSTTADLARALETRECARGLPVAVARKRLAAKLSLGPGSFANIVKGRAERFSDAVRERVRLLLVRELEQEIARLQHELEVARQASASLTSAEVGEVEAHLAAARDILIRQ